MKIIFIASIILLASNTMFGMDDENKSDFEKAKSKTMWSLRSDLAAFATSTSVPDVYGHEIQEIRYEENDNCKSYHATLKDGDSVAAHVFINGPTKGQYLCTRVHGRDEIMLSTTIYDKLRKLYEAKKMNTNQNHRV